jgi:diaminohydroxyphosphoribosylaminopyrimidine deaminase/5-amino-6-(5-phosphoribosylamino)uracil reductase
VSASLPVDDGRPAARQPDEDRRWLLRCLELAARGGSAVAPNPQVGALLVKAGRLIGEGWHRAVGGPHAEREALAACTEDPRGATLYVSLEPCHQQGRTPPCTEAVLAAGIARVVYALEDPNPQERGASHRLLAAAGLAVTGGLLAAEAAAQNPAYVHRQRTGLPYVTLKSAVSLNGLLARADGSSRWITGEAARREGHRLRAAAMAVAVGAETARLDRPRLDLRLLPAAEAAGPLPRPVVFAGDPSCAPADLEYPGRSPLLLVPAGSAAAAPPAGWRQCALPRGAAGGVDLSAALALLGGAEGIHSLLVEGGGRLLSSFLAAGLWQRWELFIAPRLLPAGGRPVWTELAELNGLRIERLRALGEDLQITLLPPPARGAA